MINNKSFFINSSGGNIRKVGKEAAQTIYVLTKDPCGDYKALTKEEKKYFLSLKKEDITFENIVKWFGNTTDVRDGDNTKSFTKSKYNPCDTLTISPGEYNLVKGTEPIKTTLGRLIFNKVFVEGLHFESIFEYQNKVIDAGAYGAFDGVVATALKDDIITIEQMVDYIDTRDWFGLQVHGVITTSFTEKVTHVPPEVQKLKKELFTKYKKEIENGDEHVIEEIENILIDAMKKALEGDLGLDLYNSGARGSVSNHLKNTMLTRGAIKNPVTKKYEIIENSLMDGLSKKDITAHANVIVSGSYPKSFNDIPEDLKPL